MTSQVRSPALFSSSPCPQHDVALPGWCCALAEGHAGGHDWAEADWWASYACAACHVVFDVRFPVDSGASPEGDICAPTCSCPVCRAPCDVQERWEADFTGHGSRGDRELARRATGEG